MKVRMTNREFELLLLINNIWEFEKINPGSIPEGGIEEVIVGNAMKTGTADGAYDSDEYRDCLQGLRKERLVNDKTEITSKGKKFLIEAFDAAEAICKAKNIDNILNDNEKVALAVAKKTKEDKEKALKLAVSTAGTFIGAILAEMKPEKRH